MGGSHSPQRTAAPPRLLAVGLLLVCLAACGRPEALGESAAVDTGPALGDTLVQASIGDISGLIPNITSDSASHEVGGLIYEGLIRTDKDLRIVGELAGSHYFLIETMAARIADICLAAEGVKAVTVSVDKPGALRRARSVAVEIRRVNAGAGGAP